MAAISTYSIYTADNTLATKTTISSSNENGHRLNSRNLHVAMLAIVADLENHYASGSAPTDKPSGKIWYDSTNKKLQYTVDTGATWYDMTQVWSPVNDANPQLRLGATDAEELHVQAVYDSGAQTLDYVQFTTDAASATADKGEYRFNVDGTLIATIDDGGIELADSMSYFIDTSEVLSETTLGATVLASSLTSLGIIASLTVTSMTDGIMTMTGGNITSATSITSTTFVGALTGQADTVATITGLAPDTATTQATQAAITTCANLTTVGALNAGSITSGFTSIDVGAGAITTTGALGCGLFTSAGIDDNCTAEKLQLADTGISATIPAYNPLTQTTYDSGAHTQDWNTLTDPNTYITLAGNPSFDAPGGPVLDGAIYILTLIQDATGTRVPSAWDAKYLWPSDTAPTLTTTALAKDKLIFQGNASAELENIAVQLDIK